MDPNKEIHHKFFSIIHIYKSNHIEHLTSAASIDPTTNVATKDVTIDPSTTVFACLYLPTNTKAKKLPILIFFHGGSFFVQSAFSPTYAQFLNSLAAQANLLLISIDYRLTPKHLVPILHDDSWAALQWVAPNAAGTGGDAWLAEHGDFDQVFLANDSAGGNIIHHMALHTRSEGLGPGVRIEGMILFHPYFWRKDPVGLELQAMEFRRDQEVFWGGCARGQRGGSTIH